jgi:hypothetical protein
MESDFVPVVANVTDLFSGEEIISVATDGQIYVQTENKKILAAYPKSFDYGVVDFSINLGTPNRSDYKFNKDRVNKVANIYSDGDLVQPFGGKPKIIFTPTLGSIVHTYASRKIDEGEAYKNFNVTKYGFPDHEELHHIGYWKEFTNSNDFKEFFNNI